LAGTDDDFGYGLLNVAAAHELLESAFSSNENSRIEFSESRYSVDEDTQKLIVTVRRSGGSKGEVRVDYTTIEDEAIQGRDYTISKGSLQFNDGETLRSFEVSILDDGLDEEDESFYLVLSNADGNAALGDEAEAEVIILDNDGAGAISFATVAYAVNESKQQAIVDVIRTGGSTGIVDVEYQLLAKSADGDIDYVDDTVRIRFQPGETQQEIHIDLIDDKLHEGNETFQLLLSSISEGASIVEPASTTITILDDDPDTETVSIHLDAVSYEVDESINKVTLTIVRSGDLEASASVKYGTIDGSAKKDQDYHDVSGTLTFPAGVTRRTLSIDIINDGVYEKESSFTLLLSDASGNAAITTPSAAIIRISDDDALPFVSIHSSSHNTSSSLSSGFSSRRDSLNKGSTQGLSDNDQTAGSSLKIFDLTLRGYDSNSLLNRLGIQDLKQSTNNQSMDHANTEEPTEMRNSTECGASESADVVVCAPDNEPEADVSVNSEEKQPISLASEADSTDSESAPETTAIEPPLEQP
jgi:hypothetical protein